MYECEGKMMEPEMHVGPLKHFSGGLGSYGNRKGHVEGPGSCKALKGAYGGPTPYKALEDWFLHLAVLSLFDFNENPKK